MMLPSELEWVLEMLGYDWPTANEDKLKECANIWRKFGDDVTELHTAANTSARQVVAHNAGESIDAFTKTYAKFDSGGDGYLANAAQAAYIIATVLEACAYIVEFAKWAVIAQLIALAIEIAAAQAAAPFTFGLSEVGALGATQAARLIVRRLLKELKEALIEAIVEAMKEPAISAIEAIITDLIRQTVNVGFGAQEGYDLATTAKQGANAGWDAIKQSPQTLAEGVRDSLGEKAGHRAHHAIDSRIDGHGSSGDGEGGSHSSDGSEGSNGSDGSNDSEGSGGDGGSDSSSGSSSSDSGSGSSSDSHSSDSHSGDSDTSGSDSSTSTRAGHDSGVNIGGGISADTGGNNIGAPDVGSGPGSDSGSDSGSGSDAGSGADSGAARPTVSHAGPSLSDFDDPSPSSASSGGSDSGGSSDGPSVSTSSHSGGGSSVSGLSSPTPHTVAASASSGGTSATPSSGGHGSGISTNVDSLAASAPTHTNAAPAATPTSSDPSSGGGRPDGGSSMPTSPVAPSTGGGVGGGGSSPHSGSSSGGTTSAGSSPSSPTPNSGAARPTSASTSGTTTTTGSGPASTPSPTSSTAPRSTPTPTASASATADGRASGAGAGVRVSGTGDGRTPGTSDGRTPGSTPDGRIPSQRTPGSTTPGDGTTPRTTPGTRPGDGTTPRTSTPGDGTTSRDTNGTRPGDGTTSRNTPGPGNTTPGDRTTPRNTTDPAGSTRTTTPGSNANTSTSNQSPSSSPRTTSPSTSNSTSTPSTSTGSGPDRNSTSPSSNGTSASSNSSSPTGRTDNPTAQSGSTGTPGRQNQPGADTGTGTTPNRPQQPAGSTPNSPASPQQPAAQSNNPQQQQHQQQVTPVPVHTPIRTPGTSAAPNHANGPATPNAPGSPQATPGDTTSPNHPQQDSLQDIRADLDHYPGGLTDPDPADQQALSDAVPRNEDGTPQRYPDPFDGNWSQLQNDGGVNVPGRSNNCADCSRSFLETWYGNPQVSAPRTLDTDANGKPDLWSPEDNANDNQIRWTGAAHTYAGPGGDPNTANNIASTLQQAGPGSAAIVQVDWPGGGGHAFNVVNHNGKIVWIDTQSGQVSTQPLHIDQATHVWHIPLDANRNPIDTSQPPTNASQGHDASQNQNSSQSQSSSQNPDGETSQPENSDHNVQPDNGQTPQDGASGDTQKSDDSPDTEGGHHEPRASVDGGTSDNDAGAHASPPDTRTSPTAPDAGPTPENTTPDPAKVEHNHDVRPQDDSGAPSVADRPGEDTHSSPAGSSTATDDHPGADGTPKQPVGTRSDDAHAGAPDADTAPTRPTAGAANDPTASRTTPEPADGTTAPHAAAQRPSTDPRPVDPRTSQTSRTTSPQRTPGTDDNTTGGRSRPSMPTHPDGQAPQAPQAPRGQNPPGDSTPGDPNHGDPNHGDPTRAERNASLPPPEHREAEQLGLSPDQAQQEVRDHENPDLEARGLAVHRIDLDPVHDSLRNWAQDGRLASVLRHASGRMDALRQAREAGETDLPPTAFTRRFLEETLGDDFRRMNDGQRSAVVASLARLSLTYHESQGVGHSPEHDRDGRPYNDAEPRGDGSPDRATDSERAVSADARDRANSNFPAGHRSGEETKRDLAALNERVNGPRRKPTVKQLDAIIEASGHKPDFSGKNYAVIEVVDADGNSMYVVDSSVPADSSGVSPRHSEKHLLDWFDRTNTGPDGKKYTLAGLYTEREPCGKGEGHADCSTRLRIHPDMRNNKVPVYYSTTYRTDPDGLEIRHEKRAQLKQQQTEALDAMDDSLSDEEKENKLKQMGLENGQISRKVGKLTTAREDEMAGEMKDHLDVIGEVWAKTMLHIVPPV
ncbi:toxin glutamine deamidase domain-containing protein [Streptomyces sp. NPDC002766]|uniref:toxin glutamine deamidase domain-containing protein n=1 Tax=Streptomyces sp. NPDC002766 TaxID=3154429 RepID=UPI00331A122B